jgi:hypothetical protein
VKETEHFGELDGRTILKWIFSKKDERLWTGFHYLGTRPTGGALQNFEFHKRQGVS